MSGLIGRLAALLLLIGALAACAPVDGGQARLCRAVLPAVELDGPIRVLAVEADAAAPNGIAISYFAGANPAAWPGRLRCAFAGGRLDTGRLNLTAVAVNDRPLSDVRMYLLRRFWLTDPDGLAEGERRLTGLDALYPLVPGEIGRKTGYALQQGVNILPLGAVYALLAAAYALVYGLVNRINLAFGDIAVVGSHVVVATILSITAGIAVGGSGLPVAMALAIAIAVAVGQTTLFGALIGEAVFRPLSRRDLRSFLVATLGLAIALSETVRLMAGSRDRWIHPILNDPIVIADGAFRVTTTAMQALEVALAAAALGGLLLLLARSTFGRSWRAAADDPLMARFLGIDTDRLAITTFALAAALAGLSGALHTLHYGHASYAAGLAIGLKALMAALIGGIGSVGGAALGGLAVAAVEVLWAAYLPVESRDVAVLAGLVLVLVLRPHGLLGRSSPAAATGDGRWFSRG